MSMLCGNRSCDIELVFIDSTSMYFEYKRHSKAQEAFDTAAESYLIYEKFYFGLQAADKNGDLFWIDLQDNLHDQVRGSSEMLFRPKFYMENPTETHDEYTLYLISMEIFRDLKFRKIPASDHVLDFFIACILQADLGDYDSEIFPHVDFACFALNMSTETRILDHYKLLKGLSPTAADSLLYEKARTIPSYSRAEFVCRDGTNNEAKLSSGHFGVLITTVEMTSYPWPAVAKVTYRRRRLTITMKSPPGGGSISLYFAEADICRRASKICNEQRKFFTEFQRGMKNSINNWQDRPENQDKTGSLNAKNICRIYEFSRVNRIILLPETSESIKGIDLSDSCEKIDEINTQQILTDLDNHDTFNSHEPIAHLGSLKVNRAVSHLKPLREPVSFKSKRPNLPNLTPAAATSPAVQRSRSRGSIHSRHRMTSSEAPKLLEMLYEVVYSECVYIHDLEVISGEFKTQMTGAIEDHLLTQLTQPFLEVLSLHKPIYTSLQKDVYLFKEKTLLTQSALTFFSLIAKSLNLYCDYFECLIANLQLIAGLRGKPTISSLYYTLERKYNTPSIRLFLRPAQQMIYYSQIMQAISNNFDRQNKDEFEVYCETITNFVRKNDEKINLALELLTLHEIQRFIETSEPIFEDPRKFVRMGVLSVSGELELVILFTDFMLFCRPQPNSSCFDLCRHFRLNELSIKFQNSSSHSSAFEITSHSQVAPLSVESPTGDISEWAEDLNKLCTAFPSTLCEHYIRDYQKMISGRAVEKSKPRVGFLGTAMHSCWSQKTTSLTFGNIKHIFSNSFSGQLTRVLSRSSRDYFTVFNNSCLYFYDSVNRLDECLRILCTLSCRVLIYQENGIKIRHPRVACLFIAESKYFHNRWLNVLSGGTLEEFS